ncbi:MAG: hypothetical protein MR346_11310 [Clostridium sp.]|nr:hypothetical protein [Clostridium sp.]
MVDLYVILIIKGRRKFNSVPEGLKNSVKEALNDLGLDENGNPLTE